MEGPDVASISITIQIIMLVLTFITGHLLRRKKIMVIHEASAALILGVLAGLVVRASGEKGGFKDWMNFNNEFFFYFLLPPIIFESGWSLNLKPFFGNFGAICTFAFAGTLISTFGIGILMYLFGLFKWTYSMPFLVCLSFGALISATDPVTVLSIFHELGTDADLYAYVFGESVLNDAVAIVMYKTVLSFISGTVSNRGVLQAVSFFFITFVGSFSIGALAGVLSALLFKYGGFQDKRLGIIESCLVVLFPYLAYNVADALELSGIVSILFAGITMKYYTAPNLSSQAQKITTSFFQMLSKLSETFVFIYIGLGTFLDKQSWNRFGFTFFTIVSILIARTLNVYPMSALINRFRPESRKIHRNQQHALCFSGLRGAMAFALARQSVTDLPSGHGYVLLTATLLTIFFSVLLIGGMTSYALKLLRIECHGPEHEDTEIGERTSEEMEEIVQNQSEVKNKAKAKNTELTKTKDKISEKLRKFKSDTSFTTLNTKYLKPFLQADPRDDASEINQVQEQSQHFPRPPVSYEDEDNFSESTALLRNSQR
ncbi:hypothetical protein KP509_02G091800 [Ceratopteris richardii]|uniref:Sodium/hydrogen exchanger n=1 Tax=Ceratopteris richardii TaxID=49495 RepID=A0A8T2VK01_CERRI|nr:hypothetical protein KP509_02G091800 [Ceratopteris richardii]